MVRTDVRTGAYPRHRSTCQHCGATCQSQVLEVLVRRCRGNSCYAEYRPLRLCAACRSAFLDLIERAA